MKELYEKYVGKKATAFLGGLSVEVNIVDVKVSYNRERYQITPVAGSGKVWVENVHLIEAK